MTDQPHEPAGGAGSPPDLTKRPESPAPEPEQRESIWQTLDGSTPARPAAAPASFTRPDPRSVGLPGAPAAPAGAPAPAEGQAVYVLASWWPRVGAYLLDSIIFSLALLLVVVPVGVGLGMTVEESLVFFGGSLDVPSSVTNATPVWVLFGAQVLLQLTLPAVFLYRWNGQTPGKRIVGLRVVTADGSPMTLGLALNREVVYKALLVGSLTIITFGIAFLANYLWPLRDAQNRAGHDILAKTRVVVAPK